MGSRAAALAHRINLRRAYDSVRAECPCGYESASYALDVLALRAGRQHLDAVAGGVGLTIAQQQVLATQKATTGRRGCCRTCGAETSVTVTGVIRSHRQHRMGPHGSYVSDVACPGSGDLPDPPPP